MLALEFCVLRGLGAWLAGLVCSLYQLLSVMFYICFVGVALLCCAFRASLPGKVSSCSASPTCPPYFGLGVLKCGTLVCFIMGLTLWL